MVYGSDIVVQWAADNGLTDREVAAGSWIGLYHYGECTSATEARHKCYLAERQLPQGQSDGLRQRVANNAVFAGTMSGAVRFSTSDYRNAGVFEVRYFKGDTRHGDGVVCRGMPGITDTFLQCMLESSATSKRIFVDADEPVAIVKESEGNIPGIEAVFHHGEEAYEPESWDEITF